MSLPYFLPSTTQEQVQHHRLGAGTPAPRTELIILGGPGTGKTYLLNLLLSLQHEFFPGSSQQCAFMNSAARLVHGRTLHTAFQLPRGQWTAAARTLGADKERLLTFWRAIKLLLIDEISMVPSDTLAQTEFRAQQVKNAPGHVWGGLSIILSGDFMQLPPVAAPSLATTAETSEATPTTVPPETPLQVQRRVDASHGQALWRNLNSCILLNISHRASGRLDDFLAAMRSGTIGPRQWEDLGTCQLGADDPRSMLPTFWEGSACVGVLRHSVRAVACLQRATRLAALAGQRLVLCLAVDLPRRTNAPVIHNADLLRYLCAVPSLTTTENLPGVLYLWHGCGLTLEEKISEQHGLIRGCQGSLEKIVFHDDEPPFDPDPSLPPHLLTYLPSGLVLRIPGGDFQQSLLLPQGACYLQPVQREWHHTPKVDALQHLPDATVEAIAGVPLSILRRQLPCTNPLACTAYNLQGKTLSALLADLSHPPGMKRVFWPISL